MHLYDWRQKECMKTREETKGEEEKKWTGLYKNPICTSTDYFRCCLPLKTVAAFQRWFVFAWNTNRTNPTVASRESFWQCRP